uniref:Zona pellucida sperm-binding protein 3 n=3 Tax=Nothobranchius pienaari TaxID=704102 RepID=A0A1A8P0C7_9TELE
MVAFVCLLWILFHGTRGSPVLRSDPVEPVRPTEDGASGSDFYRLPVFLHAPRPLVPPDLFRPAPVKEPLPAGLNALLVPPTRPDHNVPGGGARAVEVWCGTETVSVRVDRILLRSWTAPDRFRLGSCEANSVSSRYLFFYYGLKECGGTLQVVGGELVYTYVLSYTPPPQGYVIRVFPVKLPIHCRYNRFHYSYKIGFRPQVQQTTFLKGIKSKLTFSLSVCNADWKPIPSGHTFLLGEPLYFVAQVRTLMVGERLYVDSCYATSSEDPGSLPKVDIISNYGCMTDSWREGSSSRFLSGKSSVVKFSVDTFLFSEVSQVQYLHCSLSVGLSSSSISKSCSYNKTAGRWEELISSSSVCSCCGSVCAGEETSFQNRVRSSGWFVDPKEGKKTPEMRPRFFQAKEGEEPLGQDESWKDDVNVTHEGVQTFPEETRNGYKERKGELMSTTVRHQDTTGKEPEGGETEVVVMKKETFNIMSDESGSHGNEMSWVRDMGPDFRNKRIHVLSNDDGRTNSTVRTQGDVSIDETPVCPDGLSCRAGSTASNGPGTSYGSTGAEHFSTYNISSSDSSVFLHPVSENGQPEVEASPSPKRIVCEQAAEGEDLRIRGLESGFRDEICKDVSESDFDSGAIGEVLHQSLLNGEVELSATASRLHTAGSLSFESEPVQRANSSHSATVTTSLHGPDPLTARQWAELVPEWVLEHLAFLVKKPAEAAS